MTPADKPDLPEPIAVVGDTYAIFWAGAAPIARLVNAHRVKIGDGLYSASQIRRLLADERRKARAELIAEMRAKPVYWYDPDTPLAIVPEK